MFLICLSLLIVLSVNTIIATNLRCNEDINGSFQIIENCRACVIFIAPVTSPSINTTTTTAATTVLPRNMFISNAEPSIEELFLFDEKKRRRRRRRHSVDTVIHQECARELDSPLYGYDQTHCYCNSNRCNSNIQRCIYEITSKPQFACYHGIKSSQYQLEIRPKCRSCRIRTEFNSMHYYECLTFGEREQNNQTHCTCQRPMCNKDVSTCQRFQQAPSQPRTNLGFDIFSNSTTTIPTTTTKFTSTSTIKTTSKEKTTTIDTTTTSLGSSSTSTAATSTIVTTTPMTTASSTIIETTEEISTENSTTIELTTTTEENTTSFTEIKHLETAYMKVKNHANYLSSNFILIFTLLQTFLFLFIYSM